jgi:hypothetical protein
MKNALPVFAFFISITLHGQYYYYYADIIGTRELNDRMKTYLTSKVQSVTATGYDDRGMKTSDFNEWQEVRDNGSVLKIATRNGQTITRVYYQFDASTRLINTRDSTSDVENMTAYLYDGSGNLTSIKTSIKDPQHDFDQTEEHVWQYNPAGKPVKMLRILNGTDTTYYQFTLDDHGNVKDETLYRFTGGKDTVYFFYEDQRVYYYYDDSSRLTDIVKYNKKVRQLLPDYMFEYDDRNRVIQKTTVVSTTNPDYFIWRYAFDEKGLKTKEALFNKFKTLKGKIEYSYSFAQ